MDCSESTVTSRIFYAKKNIKTAVEILARQGDKLYTLLPISVLTQLFRQDSQLHTLSKQAAQELFGGIVATVSGIAGSAAAATGTATAVNATGAAASKGGLMAKFSALSTSTKVAAAGVAAAVTVAAVAIPIVFPSDYVVEWADSAFEAIVRVAIDKPDGEIRRSELDEITSFKINGLDYIPRNQGYAIYPSERPGQIESLEDLTHFKALRSLDFNSQANVDLSTIPNKEALSSLKILVIGECGLTDASILSKLTELKVLILAQNYLSDFTFISELDQLNTLNVGLNKAFVSDKSFVKLTKLNYLDASNTEYVDMQVVATIPSLEELDLSNVADMDHTYLPQLQTVSKLAVNADNTTLPYIAQMPQLERLFLNASDCTTIESLASLVNIKSLELTAPQVNDITPLLEMKDLSMLYLDVAAYTDVSALNQLEHLTTIYVPDPMAGYAKEAGQTFFRHVQEQLPNIKVIMEHPSNFQGEVRHAENSIVD